MQHQTISGKQSNLKSIKSSRQVNLQAYWLKDSRERNKYAEAHTYLIPQAGEANRKGIEDEQQKCVDSGYGEK